MTNFSIKPIKGKKVFSEVFSNGKKFYDNSASISVLFFPKSQLNVNLSESNIILYYGISIGRKASKSAVIRNRIKRLIRVSIIELFRQYCSDNYCPIQYLIIVWKLAPEHAKLIHLKDVKIVIKHLLDKALHYYKLYDSKTSL